MQTQSGQTTFDALEVARLCETDTATVYDWVKKGALRSFNGPGGRLRFHRASLLDFLRRCRFPIPPELAGGRASVIAMDNDPSSLTSVKRALSRSFDVVAYSDPYDALLAIGHEKPDAVAMEVKMPALNGVHCIRRIRESDDLRHTRIVVFSSDGSEQQACIEAGAAGFVLKPATEELHSTLRHALGQR